MCRLCVFAGTSDGRELSETLIRCGAEVTVCVATEYGEALMKNAAHVHTGRMDAHEIGLFLKSGAFDAVIDATHPYADRASKNILAACTNIGVECFRFLRGSTAGIGDGVFVEDAHAAAEYLDQHSSGNVLLTTGSKDLVAFCAKKSLADRLFARVLPMTDSLQTCEACGIRPERIIAMQGPFDEEMNTAMLRACRAEWLVTKDTGDAGGYAAKLRAAEKTGARVLIIGRQQQNSGLGRQEILRRLHARLGLPLPKKQLVLAGIGMGDSDSRTLGLERAIREADCLIGAKRMLEGADVRGKSVHIAVDPREIADIVREEDCERFAVLFSGDTGFYSGAKKLAEALKEFDVRILPGIGSLQYFCARLKRPWEDVRAISLHGRDADLPGEAARNPTVFALLGNANAALQSLIDAGMGNVQVYIGERLGYPDEKITNGSADALVNGTYDPLSVLLTENPDWGDIVITHGLPDAAFDRSDVPMTKSEIRSISISKMQLGINSVVYDVGSGSGSVSVEAALQAVRGRVYAIEKKAEAAALTRHNAVKFRLRNLEVIEGEAPEALADLPAPTHAFIGGSSGNLREIVRALTAKNPHVRIVINSVTLETLAETTEIMRDFAFSECIEVSVSCAREAGSRHLMTARNPIYIVTLQN